MRATSLLALSLAGCSSSFGDDTDITGSGDGGSPSGLDDVTDGIDTEGCEEVDGTSHPGAVSYFTGEYVDEGSAWSGTERWLLYANQAWIDTGEGDCVVTWFVDATETDVETCGACDLALDVSATVDEASTTCPAGLWEEEAERNWSGTYEIRVDGGTATWFFASGNQMGTGYASDSAVSFLTEKTCTWF